MEALIYGALDDCEILTSEATQQLEENVERRATGGSEPEKVHTGRCSGSSKTTKDAAVSTEDDLDKDDAPVTLQMKRNRPPLRRSANICDDIFENIMEPISCAKKKKEQEYGFSPEFSLEETASGGSESASTEALIALQRCDNAVASSRISRTIKNSLERMTQTTWVSQTHFFP
ncbi:hypothetical protein TNIN_247901 [Trichonephila inaurata madagascariensis]|uniref:Uncharacterized protein n=1 Tax=Trichonephila inaurata madagascariensis TaxID=2747483 RepID=A0A8X6YJE4_9ARAC|nr:hypothetical protein TNIN_247901 [Trichonephila inaurata madagascariensis]